MRQIAQVDMLGHEVEISVILEFFSKAYLCVEIDELSAADLEVPVGVTCTHHCR